MARGFTEDTNRERWRDRDRERSSYERERDEDRGFFERAGDEIRSWFGEDDRRPDRDYERGPSWERDRDRERGYGRIDRAGIDYEDRRTFGGMSQGGMGRSGGGWDRGQDRLGPSNRNFGGFRDESDFRSRRRSHPQSWGEVSRAQGSGWERDRDRGESHLAYGDFSGTLGGFGNQRFGSSQDDHYRSWRGRQLAELDRDYDDYCRECEQQFNQDFDSWRRNRQGQSPSATASNAGVGTTTASMTGSAGAGSAIGSATGTGGSIQADTTGSTETAETGGGRSGSRSRS